MLSRTDLIHIATRILNHDGTAEEIDMLTEHFDKYVKHPMGSNLFYYPEDYDVDTTDLSAYNPSIEEIVDKCMDYEFEAE